MRPTRSSSTTCRRSTCWGASSARTRSTPGPPGWPARPWPRPGTRSGTWTPSTLSPGWGTAAWAGWPPACSIPWPRWTCRRWATASGMSSGSSSRPSKMASRSSFPTTGPSTATRGSSPLPMTSRSSGSTATPRPWTTTRAACVPAGCRASWCAASRATCWSRGTAPRRSTSSGCGAPGRAGSRSTWACSTTAGTPRPSRRRCARRTSPRCSTPATAPRPAGSCGSSSSISWSPARCGTSSAGSGSATATGRPSRTRSSSSSTTPTRCWRSPS